jgi:hypothetical protein
VEVRWRARQRNRPGNYDDSNQRGNGAGKDFTVNEEAGFRIHSPLPMGTRFKMSALGAARNPRLAQKQGTVIGGSRLNRSVRVMFDGRKSPMSLHRDYIEQIPSEAE